MWGGIGILDEEHAKLVMLLQVKGMMVCGYVSACSVTVAMFVILEVDLLISGCMDIG